MAMDYREKEHAFITIEKDLKGGKVAACRASLRQRGVFDRVVCADAHSQVCIGRLSCPGSGASGGGQPYPGTDQGRAGNR